MTRSKHVRRISIVPQNPSRRVAAAMGVISLLATFASDRPRYARVLDFVLALVLLAVDCVQAAYRRRARAIVLSLMTVLLALAGVVASLSIDGAMTLVAGAITVGLMACLFTPGPPRAQHAAAGA